jgi:hypothetical protein
MNWVGREALISALIIALGASEMSHGEGAAQQHSAPLVYLLLVSNYSESLPYRRPPATGWTGIRVSTSEKMPRCEIVNDLSLKYVRDDERAMVSVNVLGSTEGVGHLIHGSALAPGPFECGSVIHTYEDMSRTPDYSFAGNTVYVTIESHDQWTDVIYHQNEKVQTLLHVPSSTAGRGGDSNMLPGTVEGEVLGDLDRDGKPDLWLEITNGGEVSQDLLFMSRDSKPGMLLKEVARTPVVIS